VNRQSGNSLVGLLAAAAIIAVLVVISMYGGFGPRKSNRADGLGKTVQGSVRADALDINCKSNLSQVRLSIQAFSGAEDTLPASLTDMPSLPADCLKCPIGHEAYEYDPATGVVKCPHPGHEKF
jgi:hypothetical protein